MLNIYDGARLRAWRINDRQEQTDWFDQMLARMQEAQKTLRGFCVSEPATLRALIETLTELGCWGATEQKTGLSAAKIQKSGQKHCLSYPRQEYGASDEQGRPCWPIGFPYDDRAADSNLIEHALKLGAIAIAAGDLFAEDLPATSSFQGSKLRFHPD
jgi:hypothetical protein